jgi:glycosyltransferase involved in cell wall biosynthesis
MTQKLQLEGEAFSVMEPIRGRYLLTTCGLPFYIDAQGHRYLDHLWVKDLREHFKYLKNFTLASPCRYGEPPKGYVALDSDPAFANVRYIDLPAPNSTLQALLMLPKSIAKYWQAVSQTDILHTGASGWPLPDIWMLVPIARWQHKFCLINVESATWRLEPGMPQPLSAKLRAAVTETVNRWCLSQADLALFTQDGYRRTLLPKNPEQGYVINASWIDAENVISEEQAIASWHQKNQAQPSVLRLLFAGRLVAAKGVKVLLAAMAQLSQQGIPVELDILGQGELVEACQEASHQIQSPAKVKLLGTVAYGPEFFELLRNYHALVVPSLSDEQPRIVYDAYSQAVPVLASDTAGIRACVEEGKTGKLVPANDAIALANVMRWAFQHRPELEQMGMSTLTIARSFTHQEMHRQRWQILLKTLNEAQIKGSAQ